MLFCYISLVWCSYAEITRMISSSTDEENRCLAELLTLCLCPFYCLLYEMVGKHVCWNWECKVLWFVIYWYCYKYFISNKDKDVLQCFVTAAFWCRPFLRHHQFYLQSETSVFVALCCPAPALTKQDHNWNRTDGIRNSAVILTFMPNIKI